VYHNIVDILSVDSAEFWRYKNANICYSESSSAAAKEAQLKTSGFLVAVVDILLDYVRKENDRSCKVVDFHHPHALKEMMSHCLNITDEPQNLEQILSDCKETLKYCVKTGFYITDTFLIYMAFLTTSALSVTPSVHSFISDISIAPLQVHYYSEALSTTGLIGLLCRS